MSGKHGGSESWQAPPIKCILFGHLWDYSVDAYCFPCKRKGCDQERWSYEYGKEPTEVSERFKRG